MASNGNNPQERLAETLRGAQGINPYNAMTPAAPEIDDLAARMIDTVAQLREIARYTSDYADNLQNGLATYERGILQRLGKVGK